MNAAIKKIPALVAEELEAANMQHVAFHSPHEGYAVLLEEVEETHAELIDMELAMRDIWGAIKIDNEADCRNYARIVEHKAIRLAAEAIQVAAMARKFRALEPEEWGVRNGN